MDGNENEEEPKQPFVSSGDRPEVGIKPDTPLGEMTVRDLATLLGQLGPTRKDFWDGTDWAKNDFDGPIKPKDWKDKEKEKEKPEKWEKHEKLEKPEKPETKEYKSEKNENDGVFDPLVARSGDQRLNQVIQALSGLNARVTQLANQIEEMKKAGEG